MATLTPKQEAFCVAYVDPKVDNASEAYRSAYDTKKMAPATINREAKVLLDNPKVATRLEELQWEAAEAAKLSLTGHLNDLKRLRDAAEVKEKFGPAIQAEMARGKASGLYVDKVEQSGPGGGPIEYKNVSDDELDRKISGLTEELNRTD